MNNKAYKPTKADLLRELESIHASLVEDCRAIEQSDTVKVSSIANKKVVSEDLSENDYLLDIPHKIEENQEDHDESAEKTMIATDIPTTATEKQSEEDKFLSNQQLLFSDPPEKPLNGNVDKEVAFTETKEASTEIAENPFLPKHVKERLEKERELYQKEIDEASKAYAAPTNNATSHDYHALVDELVAEYLPKIEQELKARLKQSLKSAAHKK